MTTALTTKKVFHRCIRCNKQHPHAFRPFCDCDGLIDTEYDLTRVTFHDHSNPLIRYFDLLPLEDPANLLRLPLTQTPCVHATTGTGSVGSSKGASTIALATAGTASARVVV